MRNSLFNDKKRIATKWCKLQIIAKVWLRNQPSKNINDWRDFNPKKAWAHYLQEIESQFFLYVNRGVQQSFMSSGNCLNVKIIMPVFWYVGENESILLVYLQDLTASPDSIQVPLLLPEVFTKRTLLTSSLIKFHVSFFRRTSAFDY